MSDGTINRFLAQGDAAAMAAFTPSPPTPPSGPDNLYLWWNTDDTTLYYWDGANWTSTFGGAGTVDMNTFEARLTASTGVPVPTTDVTAAGTIYLTPFQGELIALYDGATSWEYFTLTEISLALTNLIKGVCYDIFVYDSAGLTLEAVAWKQVAASNNPAAGSSVVININDTATLVVGMDVTVRDGSASEISRITALVSNTSITVDTLANSYTTPNIYGFRERATALALQDGVYVKTGATARRYCGTIVITATTAQTEDSASLRGVWNYYNRVPRAMTRQEGTDSWNYTIATWRQANGSKSNQLTFVTGVLEDSVEATASAMSTTNTATVTDRRTGIGQNRTATNDATLTGYTTGSNTQILGTTAFFRGYPPIGRNYLAWLEAGQASNTTTWYGDAGDAAFFHWGMVGMVFA